MDTGAYGTEVHGDDDRLERYVLGRLAENEVVEVEEHLILCEACRDKLEEIGAFAPAMRQELQKPWAEEARFDWLSGLSRRLSGGLTGWLSRPGFAMAGAFAAIVLAFGIYWIGRSAGSAPVASLQLMAVRNEAQPTVEPARELDLTFADAPARGAPFQVEVVDASGGKVWSGSAEQNKVKVTRRLSPGDYFVRLYSASGQLLHEYEFRVKE